MWQKTYSTTNEITAIGRDLTGGVVVAERQNDQTTIRHIGKTGPTINLELRVHCMRFLEDGLYVLLKDTKGSPQAMVGRLDSDSGRLSKRYFVDGSSMGFEIDSGQVYVWNSMYATRYPDLGSAPERLNSVADPTLYYRANLVSGFGAPCFSMNFQRFVKVANTPSKIHLLEPGVGVSEWTLLLSREKTYHVLRGNDNGIVDESAVPSLSMDEWSPMSILGAGSDVLVCFRQRNCIFKAMLMLRLTSNGWTTETLSGLKNFVLLPSTITGQAATRIDLLTGEYELYTSLN